MSTKLSLKGAVAELKQLAHDGRRQSERVVELWEKVIARQKQRLGSELWQILEQVCIAALDCNKMSLARQCLHSLDNQFPKSLRVMKLEGMLLESYEKYDDAVEVYMRMLREDEQSSIARKRIVTIYKARGQIREAIGHLNEYLKICMSDGESWLELCDLYLMAGDYSKAAFCMEEVLLSNPHHHCYHQKYAEILYTMGGIENTEKARSYFAQSIKLNPDNIRSLFGFYLAALSVASHQKSTGKVRSENLRWANWAMAEICRRYEAAGWPLKPFADDEVKQLASSLQQLQLPESAPPAPHHHGAASSHSK